MGLSPTFSLSAQLWQTYLPLAETSLHSDFVQRLYDGTLPAENFAYYMGQDAFFLEAFARAYSIAAAKAPDWEGFQTFHQLAGGVQQELQLHSGYAQIWGVELSTVQPGGATRRYTDFLLATAWSQPVGLTAIAMSPCMRLYAFIGQTLAQKGIPDHTYGEWVRTYSSDEFEPLAQQLEALVDRYGVDSPLAHDTYRYAMECERDFFQAAWDL
jgi:thiaminase/transcriptional activator TenA